MKPMELIRGRQSVRAFLPKPVEREVVEEVLDAARWAPSYKNSQPWRVAVVAGERRRELSRLLISLLEQGEPPCPDIPEPGPWPTAEAARIEALYAMRRQATGLDLRDPQVVMRAKRANFDFYGAPVALFLHQDAALPLWSLFDLGLFAQNVMLAAYAKGLGTVPQAFVTDYARQTKEFLGIPQDHRLVLGISLGYPDWKSPANSLRPGRDEVEQFTTWHWE